MSEIPAEIDFFPEKSSNIFNYLVDPRSKLISSFYLMTLEFKTSKCFHNSKTKREKRKKK